MAWTGEVTVDAESDWGGRSSTTQAIAEVTPYLLNLFEQAGIKAIFFLSTQYLQDYLPTAKLIHEQGHTIGSHGHVHRNWKGARWWQWRVDYLQSMTLIEKAFALKRHQIPYRAPKFSWQHPEHRYSNPMGHRGLLKCLWLKQMPPDKSILYLHPFDLLENPKTPAPDLLLRTWYSRPTEARQLLEKILLTTLLTSTGSSTPGLGRFSPVSVAGYST